MKKIAIIGGSGFNNYGNGTTLFIKRHPNNIPPHKIDHSQNLKTILDQNIKNVIGISSVGSLKPEIIPGMFVLPDDYINLNNVHTIHHERAVHIVPGFDETLRKKIIKAAKELGIELIDHGTYYQTQGPRFETKAEIRMMGQYADVVGMTMANEATIAQEMGLRYVSICIVDNFANGVTMELNANDWKKNQENNIPRITKLLDYILK